MLMDKGTTAFIFIVFLLVMLTQLISVNQLHLPLPRVSLNWPSTTLNGTQTSGSESGECPKPSFSKEKLPITALASFPGSGNTWARHLIQSMTGILTGAIYTDPDLKQHGFPGEGKEDGSVIVIKTHLIKPLMYKRCVILMRNPYSAFMAEFNRQKSNSHTGSAGLDNFCKDWDKYLTKSLPHYKSFYLSWLKHEKAHLVMFDSLVEDMDVELTKLLDFLRNSTSVKGHVRCAASNSRGEHKRNHSKSASPEFLYSKNQRSKVNQMIDDLYNEVSKRFGKQVDVMKRWKLS